MKRQGMMRGISFKLFVITAFFFILFLSMTLIFQTVYFERFYINKKTERLQKELEQFKTEYVYQSGEINGVSGAVNAFADNNSADLVIVKQSENSMTLFSTIQIDSMPQEPFGFFISPAIGAIQEKDVLVTPGMIQVKPFVEYDTIKSRLVAEALSKVYQQNSNSGAQGNGKSYTYTYKQPGTNMNYIVITSFARTSGLNRDVLIAVASMQPIEEAVSVIREFYIYIFAAAIVIILILSFSYSNMIAKPLVELNKSAQRMAELDFTVRCDEGPADEIGNLGVTLNFLSQKLNTTLEELKGANKKLQEDIEKEKSLERQRKDFIADVSHELKTPLSLIRGYAEGLKDDVVEADKKDFYFDVIIDEAGRMSEIVSDLLDLSQMEAGVYKLSRQEFYLDELVQMVFKKFGADIEKKGIRIEQHVLGTDLAVYGDRRKIEQVLTNLLSNALRHTAEAGQIRILVEEKSDTVYLEMENTGEAIPEEEIGKIWDKFYRVEKSRSKKLGGTGLGLAIVRNILLLHGSCYGAMNTVNGVSFYFELQKLKRV